MTPWLVGFTVFFAYPLVMSAYLSFTHYDLLSAPRWVGTANYHYLFEQDQRVWPAVKNTLWMMVVFAPRCRCCSRSGLHRCSCGPATAQVSSARSSISRRWHRRWRRRWASSICSTRAPGPVNVALERLGLHRRRSGFGLARVVEAIARSARALGHRNDDDHLPGRARSTYRGSYYESAEPRQRGHFGNGCAG